MKEDFKQFFYEITNLNPYNFQIKVADAILNGKSIILRAPTGSGKSEAVLIPYLYLFKGNKCGINFPNQLIYSLPVRVLVNNLGNRFEKYSKGIDKITFTIHHGENPGSELFLEDIILTTIDQTVGAYCCVPLSMSLRSGNIPAGSVSSAFLVFDEVHVYDLDFALQAMIILLEHSYNLKIPFAILSATIPDYFIKFLKNKFRNFLEVIDVKNEKEIESRKNRKIFIQTYFNDTLETYLENHELPKDKRIIIVCNTVKKAQEIFLFLKQKQQFKNIFLIHSQFTSEDRKEKEKKLEEIFGKNSNKKGILISTQVIEVGMNISCDLMISELAPIDSLIQRAGRVSRWGGKGKMIIVGLDKNSINPYAPYDKEICEKTKEKLNNLKDTTELNWELERKLVNEILNKRFKESLNSGSKGTILNLLAEAAFQGDKALVENSLRDQELTCQISIHRNPQSLEDKVFYLPRINISYFKLKKFFEDISQIEKNKQFIWEIGEENIINNQLIDERISKFKPITVQEIKPYKFYIISSDVIKYDPEMGLILERGKSKDFVPKLPDVSEDININLRFKRETWIDHAIRTVKIFEKKILAQNKFIFKRLAEAWQIPEEDLIVYLKLAIGLHDAGKLNKKWQMRIYKIEGEKWDESKQPLAHSSKKDFIGIPHAPVSGELFKVLLKDTLRSKENFLKALIYAVAHHHSPRTYEFKDDYELPDESVEELKKFINFMDSVKIDIDNNKIKKGRVCLNSFPNFEECLLYRTYTIFSKFLRLSDREAAEKKHE